MIILTILSFYLDGIINNLLNISYLKPLFSLCLIVLIYPYIKKNNSYLIFVAVIGLLYDISYTNTFILNMVLFLMLGYLITKLSKKIRGNYYLNITLTFIIIILYRILYFIILCLIDYLSFDMVFLLKSIYNSLLLNILYIVIMTLILRTSKRKIWF